MTPSRDDLMHPSKGDLMHPREGELLAPIDGDRTCKLAVLFDLDGTLTESDPGITKSIRVALDKLGVTDVSEAQLKSFVGPPLRESFGPVFDGDQEKIETAILYFRERYETIGKFENRLYPGITELLQALKDTGAVLGIASSKPEKFVYEILEHFGILSYFSAITGASMDESLVEKDDILELTLGKLKEFGDPASDAVYMVGDRKYDIDAANRFGVHALGVSYGYGSIAELQNAGAEYIADSAAALRNYFAGKD